jgi:hypothetical protein
MLTTIMVFTILQFVWTFIVSATIYGKLSEIAENTKLPSVTDIRNISAQGNDHRG